MKEVAVIGIGNVMASDDGVGIRAVEQLRHLVCDERICFVQSERGGLDLLGLLEGYPNALIVDAAWTGSDVPGTICSFRIRSPFAGDTLPSLHTIGLRTVLAFGASMGVPLPEEVTVYTVEARDIETFHEGCTPEVERATKDLTDILVRELREILPDLSPAGVESHQVKRPTPDTISMECL